MVAVRAMERHHRPSMPSNGSVKIGGLWKRSQGLSRFTRPNFKHRVFILTDQALSYYSGTVDVSGCTVAWSEEEASVGSYIA